MQSTQEMATATHDEFAPMEAWEEIAADYAAHVTPGEERLSDDVLRIVGVTHDDTFLDVAAGPGGLGMAAARLGASVLATDWAPGMVAQFEAAAHEAGLTNAEARVMEAHALDLEDDRFDATGSQFGVMLVPDQLSALREMVRVTRPGGRVVLVAYGAPAEFEALQFFIAALQAVVPEFEGLPEPLPLEFQVSDPEVLRQRLAAAGLIEVEVDTTHEERVEMRSGQDCWDWMCGSNPIVGMILGDVTAEDQGTLRQVLDGMIRERAGDSGVAVLTAPLNIGWGRKPTPG